MHGEALFSLTLIVALGAVAQWVGWRLKFPAIILLLLFGFVAGPLSGVLRPDDTFGDLLFPAVSLAVAVILFEGGLSLTLRELDESGDVILRLVTIGVAVAWLLTALAAHWILDFSWGFSILLGALLVITGPTVILPMLRTIRPKANVARIAKWEGILDDPIGALLAVLVFEALMLGESGAAPSVIFFGILKSILVAVALGGGLGWAMTLAVRRKWIPEFLHNSVTLTMVAVAFFASNSVQEESGLLTVTLLGVYLANQTKFEVRHIIEFKENLRVLLISSLFVVLAARVELDILRLIAWDSLLFLLALTLVVRPAAIFLSTIRSSINWKEKVLLSMLAPRGIVVAAVASLFALKLEKNGYAQGDLFLADILLVIIGTVVFYGFCAGPVARRLGLSSTNPHGVLFVGAHAWARRIAAALQATGVKVMLIDYNRRSVANAEKAGLEAHRGNVFSEKFLEELDLTDIGHVIAFTANDEVNAFAETTLAHYVDRSEVYHVAPESDKKTPFGESNKFNPLFADDVSYPRMETWFRQGAEIKEITLKSPDEYKEFQKENTGDRLPMFSIGSDGTLEVFNPRKEPAPSSGTKVVYLQLKEPWKELAEKMGEAD